MEKEKIHLLVEFWGAEIENIRAFKNDDDLIKAFEKEAGVPFSTYLAEEYPEDEEHTYFRCYDVEIE